MDPTILEQTEHYLALDKPAGLLSVPGVGPGKADCAIARVRAMIPSARGPMIIHRLDMETSGILLVAITPEGQRAMSGLFERREVAKGYEALLESPDAAVGGPPAASARMLLPPRGEIQMNLRPNFEDRPRQMIDPVHGRFSRSRYEMLDADRVRFEPVTGRSHQLRVHAAWGLGRPIAGDPLYGRRPAAAGAPRLMLHATWLRFVDPFDGRERMIQSPCPF